MTRKKTTNKRKTRRTPKPKVYIPAYKIIILCVVIIAVCMLLLLVTTWMSKKEDNKNDDSQITKDISSTEENTETFADDDDKLVIVVPDNIPEAGHQENHESINQNADLENSPDDLTQNFSSNLSSDINKQSKTSKDNKLNQKKLKNTESKKHYSDNNDQSQWQPDNYNATKKTFGFPMAENKAELVFVFDDGGHSLSQAEAFMDLPFHITVAVLPRLEFSKETADLVRKNGNEVILHQPMQAVNRTIDPGLGAITPDMTDSEIITTLFQNITEIGPIVGINNHEGSAITADAEKMSVILKFASQEGLFFLDSRTNPDTKVPYVAQTLGYSYYERNIFLDNEKTRDNILKELKKGLTIANKTGSVIMIGHVWSADILPEILKEVFPELAENGFSFSVVSKSKAIKY